MKKWDFLAPIAVEILFLSILITIGLLSKKRLQQKAGPFLEFRMFYLLLILNADPGE